MRFGPIASTALRAEDRRVCPIRTTKRAPDVTRTMGAAAGLLANGSTETITRSPAPVIALMDSTTRWASINRVPTVSSSRTGLAPSSFPAATRLSAICAIGIPDSAGTRASESQGRASVDTQSCCQLPSNGRPTSSLWLFMARDGLSPGREPAAQATLQSRSRAAPRWPARNPRGRCSSTLRTRCHPSNG